MFYLYFLFFYPPFPPNKLVKIYKIENILYNMFSESSEYQLSNGASHLSLWQFWIFHPPPVGGEGGYRHKKSLGRFQGEVLAITPGLYEVPKLKKVCLKIFRGRMDWLTDRVSYTSRWSRLKNTWNVFKKQQTKKLEFGHQYSTCFICIFISDDPL